MKLTALLIALLTAQQALACCMLPVNYLGAIRQTAQQAILLHDAGREELILRINYAIEGEQPPDRFAWVVTVPNEPDAYAVSDAMIFDQVFAWSIDKVKPPPPRSIGCSKMMMSDNAAAGGLEFGERRKVGPYDIQPVRATGLDALSALNDWLSANGFPTEDPQHMVYFVENKFTFLAIKINPAEGATTVNPDGKLVPLQLSFASEQPYYPLRFSSRQGVFNVGLVVLTKRKFDYQASHESLKKISWSSNRFKRNVKVKPAEFPALLADALDQSAFKEDAGKWYLNVLQTRRTNANNAIASWQEDVFFVAASRGLFGWF